MLRARTVAESLGISAILAFSCRPSDEGRTQRQRRRMVGERSKFGARIF